ncbi:MAG: hypothetical protein GMKNLPBB_01354 [Myxococcota bacterium]|nr:hypothetical protein [Myxococcota bacterium]
MAIDITSDSLKELLGRGLEELRYRWKASEQTALGRPALVQQTPHALQPVLGLFTAAGLILASGLAITGFAAVIFAAMLAYLLLTRIMGIRINIDPQLFQ